MKNQLIHRTSHSLLIALITVVGAESAWAVGKPLPPGGHVLAQGANTGAQNRVWESAADAAGSKTSTQQSHLTQTGQTTQAAALAAGSTAGTQDLSTGQSSKTARKDAITAAVKYLRNDKSLNAAQRKTDKAIVKQDLHQDFS